MTDYRRRVGYPIRLRWGNLFLWSNKFREVKQVSLKTFSFSWWLQVKLFLRHRQLRGMGILGMVMHFADSVLQLFLPLLIVNELGLSYQSIGLALFVFGLSHFFQGIFGAWGDKWGHRKIVLVGTLLSAVCFTAIYFIFYYWWWLLLLLFILGFGTSMWNVAAWSLMYQAGEKDKIVAQVYTTYLSLAKIGSLASFLISAGLVKVWGTSSVFLASGAVILGGAILAYRYLKV